VTDTEMEILFLRYFKRLIYFATKFVSKQEAEDAVMDVFVKCWGRDEMDIKFLMTSVKNKCFDIIKQNKVKEKWSRNERYLFREEYTMEAERQTNVVEFYIKVKISQLPPQQRKVMELYMDGLKPDDIAKTLSITVSSVRVMRARFINSLKEDKQLTELI
jgi:RNA polymerase sigma factor (sigma-70 family)